MSASAAEFAPGRRVPTRGRRPLVGLLIVAAFALVGLIATFYVVLDLGAGTLVKVGLIAALGWLAVSIVAVAVCVASSRAS